jgi:hypothetical protein
MTTMNNEPFTSEQTLELAVPSKVSMPESTKLSLDNLFEALDVMATITSVPEEDRGTEHEAAEFAPIFSAFADLGKRLMTDAHLEFTRKSA